MTKKTVFYADWAPAGYDFGKDPVRELATDVPDANGADVPQKENQMKKERTPCPFPFVHILKTWLKNISNFPPIIIYTIFVQIAIGKPKKFVYFSAKLLSIFLTIYWKSVFRSVIMDYANMIYVMQTRHQFGR